jgi:hypothetical protein
VLEPSIKRQQTSNGSSLFEFVMKIAVRTVFKTGLIPRRIQSASPDTHV